MGFLPGRLPQENPSPCNPQVKSGCLLAAHLTASLDLAYPHFRYAPPSGTPAWKT